MSTPLRRATSLLVGWLADVRLPKALRAPLYRAYARHYGVDLGELRLALADHPSLSAFFVRRLAEGARGFPADPALLVSPVDGCVQHVGTVAAGSTLQAKGQSYSVAELLGEAQAAEALEGGSAWTLYLGPRDYHRVHAPIAAALGGVRWIPGGRYSVAPAVLERRKGVLATNERCVLRLESAHGALWLVLVGALNVGRIRVVGLDHGAAAPVPPPRFERGAELARFELGSTVVLLAPKAAWEPEAELAPGAGVRLGQTLGRLPR
jgi:phosphatidylserine decarboxylase